MNENENEQVRCLGEKEDTPQQLDVRDKMNEEELVTMRLKNDLLGVEVQSAKVRLKRDEALLKAEQRGG